MTSPRESIYASQPSNQPLTKFAPAPAAFKNQQYDMVNPFIFIADPSTPSVQLGASHAFRFTSWLQFCTLSLRRSPSGPPWASSPPDASVWSPVHVVRAIIYTIYILPIYIYIHYLYLLWLNFAIFCLCSLTECFPTSPIIAGHFYDPCEFQESPHHHRYNPAVRLGRQA